MYTYLLQWIQQLGVPYSETIAISSIIGFIIISAILIFLILQFGVFKLIARFLKKSNNLFLQTLSEEKLFSNIGYVVQCIILSLQFKLWLPENSWLDTLITLANIGAITFALTSLFAFLHIIEKYFIAKNLAQNFPIRGISQTLKLIASILVGILIVSMIIGKSPIILLSGLGAMTAVLMLVFKDPILGLVAGIQLSANKMLNLGDWLEMPKYNADGDVIDIGLTTVKVRNWDNTVTTIPTYALISDSFKNWQAMSESGGRRIKRAIFIDSTSVKFLSKEEIEQLKESKILTQYLTDRQNEVEHYNRSHHIVDNNPLNGRHLTNVGTFRAYLTNYLKNHDKIHKGMTIMVRQLAPDEKGMALEIYCFTNTVAWVEYEDIQSDIFDHIFAVAPKFGLHIYQSPSGYDLRTALSSLQSSQSK